MAILADKDHGIENCNKFLIVIWFQAPVASQCNLLEFGGYPPIKTPQYYPSHWNFLGTFGMAATNSVPIDDIGGAEYFNKKNGYWTRGVFVVRDVYTAVYHQESSGTPVAFGFVQQSPGGPYGGSCFASNERYFNPPMLFDLDFVNQTYTIPDYTATWTFPWYWGYGSRRLAGRLYGEYFCFPWGEKVGSPWAMPIYDEDASDFWEPGWTQFPDPIEQTFDWATSQIGVGYGGNIVVQLGGALRNYRYDTSGIDGYTVLPTLDFTTTSVAEENKWHCLLVAGDLRGDALISDRPGYQTGIYPDTSKKNTLYVVLDGVVEGGTDKTGNYADYYQQYKIADHDPYWTAPYSPELDESTFGTGIIVAGYPISLPYDESDLTSKTSSAPESPQVKRRYAVVQAWFGKTLDLTNWQNIEMFLKVTRDDNGNLVGNINRSDDAVKLLGKPDIDLRGGPSDFVQNAGTAGGKFEQTGTIVSTPGPKDIPIPAGATVNPSI